MRAALLLLTLLGCSGSFAQEATPLPPAAPNVDQSLPVALPAGAIEGMTVSCQTWGREWGDDEMVVTMRELRDLGVEWIAIHPYAGISNDGSVRFRPFDLGSPPEHIARPIREAHALGMKIMIKPHIGYWGSKFDWRGSIKFDDPDETARFFAQYQAWIEAMAVASAGADMFVVGTELDKIADEAAWRRIIAGVRSRYDGPLTFASNWDSYERIAFWDALDAVGIQAYFPLVKGPRAATDAATLAASWKGIMGTLSAYSKRLDRPIVFTELGYNVSSKAAAEPWAYEQGGDDAIGVQTRCMTAALEAIRSEPTVRGAFIWKWFSGRAFAEDFLASTPPVRATIREVWGEVPKSPANE